jgi:hypothetical protein
MKWVRGVFWSVTILFLIIILALYRLHELNLKPIITTNFSWINKIEIYSLGGIMSLLAAPIYPEVAREHMMLYARFSEDPKIIDDDFFMRSSVVQNAIERAKLTGQSYRLAWPVNVYQFSFDREKYWEARIALALNGGHLRVESNKVIVKVKVGYPQNSFAPLLPIPGLGVIGVEEGLFWILQEEAWFHTGYVEWIAVTPI